MAKIENFIGRNRDFMQIAPYPLTSVGAGAGQNYYADLLTVPNLQAWASTGLAGMQPINSVTLKTLYLMAAATITGVATNNFTLTFWQYRSGAILVNTTAPTTVVAGLNTVTPASMTNIAVGSFLVFAGGTGSTETVEVIAITATTFQAYFANGHSGAYTITSASLATVTFASGTNATAHTPLSLAVLSKNAFIGGDVLVMQSAENGTGLAQPLITVQPEWVPIP